MAEEAQRGRLCPEEKNRLVEKRLAEKRRGDVIAAEHHLLRDRGVQPFVRIEERCGRNERRKQIRERHRGENRPQPVHAARYLAYRASISATRG
jgi:hypothetical protein